MNDSLFWLMIANIIVWIAMGLYLACLAIAQKKLFRRCRNLEMMIDERHS